MSTLTTSVPQSGPIPEGCRTETLFQLAEDMFLRGYGTDAVFDALIYDNRTRCQPPLGYAALQQIAAAAVRSFAVNRGFTLLESAWPDQIAQAMLEKANFPVRHIMTAAG